MEIVGQTYDRKTWEQDVFNSAGKFLKGMQESWFTEIHTSAKLLPVHGLTPEERVDVQRRHIEIFLDHLLSGTVSLAAGYVNSGTEFEDIFVDMAKKKFAEFRAGQAAVEKIKDAGLTL